MKFVHMILALVFAVGTGTAQSLVLDLKTHVTEKTQLAPAKVGASYWLVRSGFRLLDIGEDYSVWLTDYAAVTKGHSISVTLTVKIEPTTALSEKVPLASRTVNYTLDLKAARITDLNEPATKFLREKLERVTDQAVEEGIVGGKVVAQAVEELLKGITTKGK